MKRALSCYEKAISLIEDDTAAESVKNLARWLSNTCLCYYKLGEVDNCIRDGMKSIEILKGLADEEDLLGKTYRRIIRAHMDRRHYDAVIAFETDASIP